MAIALLLLNTFNILQLYVKIDGPNNYLLNAICIHCIWFYCIYLIEENNAKKVYHFFLRRPVYCCECFMGMGACSCLSPPACHWVWPARDQVCFAQPILKSTSNFDIF